jgi:hypothetical protein
MTDRELLIELLAIKLYEHSSVTGVWPPRLSFWKGWPSWARRGGTARNIYRDIVKTATAAEDLYEAEKWLREHPASR